MWVRLSLRSDVSLSGLFRVFFGEKKVECEARRALSEAGKAVRELKDTRMTLKYLLPLVLALLFKTAAPAGSVRGHVCGPLVMICRWQDFSR